MRDGGNCFKGRAAACFAYYECAYNSLIENIRFVRSAIEKTGCSQPSRRFVRTAASVCVFAGTFKKL